MLCLFAVVLCVAAIAFSACNNDDTPPANQENEYAFEFTGQTTIAGKNYHVSVVGSKDDDTFELLIAELPALSLDGKYDFEAGKGYRFTFDDKDDTVKVPRYDTATHEFKFTYTLNLGGNIGSGNVPLTYVDETFVPSGETFFEPFCFIGSGEIAAYGATFDSKVWCYEDGSVSVITVCNLVSINPGTGTWTYNSDTDTYTLTYTLVDSVMGNREYTATSSATGENGSYTFDLTVSAGLSCTYHVVYTPEV